MAAALGDTRGSSQPAQPQEHILLSSRRRDGRRVATPVWFVPLGGFLYARTPGASGKVRRIRRDPGIEVAPCDAQGAPWGAAQPYRARVMEENDPLLPGVEQALQEKYGARRSAMTRLMEEQGEALVYLEMAPQGQRLPGGLLEESET